MDQISGQMMVYDTSGELLGQIKVPPANRAAPILSGITLVNRKGNVQLNQLHIRGWSGLNPSPSAQAGKISVVLNGEVHAANDLRVSNGKVALLGGDGVRRLDLDDVIVISFPSESLNEEHQITVTWQDGTRISGDLLSATKNEFVIRSYLASEPIHLPLTGLRSLWFGKKKVDSKMAPADRRAGTLELMDTRMKGWLVEGIRENEPTGSCLVWQAAEALAPSPLKKDVYGRILYVEPPAPVRISRPNNSARQRQLLAAARLRPNRRPKPVKARNEKLAGTAVHLRSGDAIPCKVTSIDKRGVHIESDLTESRSIPHNQVKAAQLTRTVAMPLLAKNKRQRLLTLPRMQRDIPPQHLLFSTKGDVLRGSILSMGELDLDLELRLDAHRIPRDRVSAIVWLHEDEVSEDGEGETDQGDDLAVGGNEADIDKMQVQVIGSTGSRLSFFAGSFSDQTIHGYSDVLKNVHASLGEIDQLLIGGFIHRAARTLPYHRWRLTAARDPKFVTEGDETGRETIAGTESNLVNEPAPPIRLKMLEGDKDFQLSDHLGHCVVLDFWASWCGPCLQVMPQVEQVVSEFAEKDVRVFAINLEETAEQVQATLERRQIHLPVALDRDGVAAARYEATAIPQTVVIGPDGNVARVFVGSSRHFAEQLRAALVELTQTEEHE
jgi:thiol-disulfide isomerase/thioredoxin